MRPFILFCLSLALGVQLAADAARLPHRMPHLLGPTSSHPNAQRVPAAAANQKPVCKSYTDNFTSKNRIISANKYKPSMASQYRWIDISPVAGSWRIVKGKGLEMIIQPPKKHVGYADHNKYEGYGVTFNTTRMMLYGSVEFEIQASNLGGAVTAAITMSPTDSDEIDLEFIGKEPFKYQTTFYADNTVDYSNGQYHQVSSDISKLYHTYRFDWHPDYIAWSVDGVLNRKLTMEDTIKKYKKPHFPNTPSFIQIGFWDGSVSPGTADWSGGPIRWSNKPAPKPVAYFKRVKIECNPKYNKVI